MLSVLLLALLMMSTDAFAQQQQSVAAETDCLMRQYAIQASNSLLPACRLWNTAKCQLQINAVYESLFKANCALSTPTAEKRFTKASPLVNSAFANNTVYVSPTGNDSHRGTQTKPLLTLNAALQKIAEWKKPHELKTIKLLGGEYTISNTVEITSVHNNLTIIGDNNNTTLAGLVNLKNLKWEKHTNAKIIKTVLSTEQTAQLDTYSHLFINGKPQIRARFPNMPKFTDFQYSSIKPKKWGKGKTLKTTKVINRDMTPAGVQYMPKSTAFNKFSLGFASNANTFDPPVSYFFNPKHQAQGACPHTLPTSVTFNKAVFPTVWKRPAVARFHALHWYGWGLWTFQLKSQTKKGAVFAKGGWQEARGDCGKGGKLWFVDNALELLDAPNEYFLDLEAKTLYLYVPQLAKDNPLMNPKSVLVELGSNITTLLSVTNAAHISISNVEFKGGYEVTMKPFEVPSGGDWSLHRSAAVFVDSSSQVLIEDSAFTYNAGNALFINGNSSQVRIVRNEFYGIGSSCVLIAGLPGYYTPDPWVIKSFPQDVVVANNLMSHFGLSVKQSSGVFISLSKQITVKGNTIYNGPRAGITINDQFAGGHLIQQNLVFEQTLETSDNGPFIVWHRQMYEEPMGEKDFDYVENNFFLGSYGVGVDGGGKGINVDDGAFKVKSRNNVVVWGFHKIKGADVEVNHNLFVNPITTSCVYFSYYTRTPAELSYHDNTCVTSFAPYAFGIATASLTGVCDIKNFRANNNTFYYDGVAQTMEQCAKNWNYWTKTWLQDTGSVYSKQRPSPSAVGEMVRQKLEWV